MRNSVLTPRLIYCIPVASHSIPTLPLFARPPPRRTAGPHHPRRRGGLEETSPDDFLAIIGENLITAFNVLKCATHCVCPPATAAAAGAGAAAVKRMPAAMAPAGAPVEEEAPSQQRRPTAESSGCSIVLMSSATAGHGMWLGEAWSAAKAGVEGLARSAAATYAPRGLRINVVAPGFVEDKWAGEVPAEEISKVRSVSVCTE